MAYITGDAQWLWNIKKIIKTSTWSLEVCFFWALEIDDNPDYVQSANVDESEHCAN